MKNEEHHIQKSCVQWFGLKYPKMDDLLIGIPNGGKRHVVVAAKLKAEGAKAGVPDLFFAYTHLSLYTHIAGLWIEMKTPTGRLKPSQKHYLKRLAGQGYAVAVCRSLEEFQKVINNYLAGEHVNDEKLTA